MKKIIWKILFIIVLLTIYMYTIAITSIPNNIVLFQGESIDIKTVLGLKANFINKGETIETISNNQNKTVNSVGKNIAKLSLFDNIFIKDINIDVLPQTTIIPVGTLAGIKLYTSGVLVVRNVRNKRN